MLSLVLFAALAQPLPSALYRASREATALVELELPLITSERSDLRWQRALREARVKALVATRAPMDTPESLELPPLQVMRSCLSKTNHRLKVRLLLFLTGTPLRPVQLPQGVFGLGLESTPGYEALKAALADSFEWVDEGRRAAGDEQAWQRQRRALGSDNPYLRHLAAEFLVQHGATEVIDSAWGPPGSEAREKNEATARVAPDCKG